MEDLTVSAGQGHRIFPGDILAACSDASSLRRDVGSDPRAGTCAVCASTGAGLSAAVAPKGGALAPLRRCLPNTEKFNAVALSTCRKPRRASSTAHVFPTKWPPTRLTQDGQPGRRRLRSSD